MLNAVGIGCGLLSCQEKVNEKLSSVTGDRGCKLQVTGAALYDTCVEMCKLMSQLGIAIDGGKDSLSMAARVGSETVKAPGKHLIFCVNYFR